MNHELESIEETETFWQNRVEHIEYNFWYNVPHSWIETINKQIHEA